MRKEVRQLRRKAINSLVLSIEHFNRPWDRGRTEAVLILLDHGFEMLLKAAIRHRLGKIRKRGEKQTIGFGACVRKGLTEAGVRFLSDEQALTLQSINGQRDAAQHYLLDMSEHQLYFYAQAGVTLFRDIHDDVFDDELVVELPERVLPVSTTAPRDLATLFDKDVEEIKGLLVPGTRRKMEAIAKARSLSVLEGAVNGNYEQPSDRELGKVCKRLADGQPWTTVFPGGGLDQHHRRSRRTEHQPATDEERRDARAAPEGRRRSRCRGSTAQDKRTRILQPRSEATRRECGSHATQMPGGDRPPGAARGRRMLQGIQNRQIDARALCACRHEEDQRCAPS